MKLDYRFIQLPLKFDANRLLEEVSALGESVWQPHHQGFAGNFAMTLITPNGVNKHDGFVGPMQPTEYLKSCPYLMDVLRCIGGVWGRTRLMKLSGQAEVTAHIDVDYYWRERMRVHVPIVTQPNVRFYSGDQDINMKVGECWIFDTWSMHNVINHATEERIHLVADTVGGDTFSKWMRNGRPNGINIPGWQAQSYDSFEQPLPPLRLESQNQSDVMTPWEMREHLSFLFNEAVPHPDLQTASAITFELCQSWHYLWTEFGNNSVAYPHYAELLHKYMHIIKNFQGLQLRNGASLYLAIINGVAIHCLRDSNTKIAENRFAEYASAANKIASTNARFERPVIVVSSPRSGSTMFFEALEQCADLSSIGGESHVLFETIKDLHPVSKNYDSNVLSANDCTPEISRELQTRFFQHAVKPDGSKPKPDEPMRLLEKTPKNALRIPFMTRLFPDALFVYLYRHPKQVISSMMDAWQSGRFITYPDLPGWTGSPWSLLLTPGWRDLIGLPLHHVVAHQWAAATKIMLDDLEVLDTSRVIKIRYESLIEKPQDELNRICTDCGISAIENLSTMPLSQFTLTPPDPNKWLRNEPLINEIWPIIEAQAIRAERYMADTP